MPTYGCDRFLIQLRYSTQSHSDWHQVEEQEELVEEASEGVSEKGYRGNLLRAVWDRQAYVLEVNMRYTRAHNNNN